MATYTDKLFKFRNGRWEDLLSDEVNRDVASRFAGRSVACVDRTVSRQDMVGRGHLRSLPTPHAPPALPCRVLGDLSPGLGTSPFSPHTGAGVPPSSPGLSGLAAPPAEGTAGACPHGCRQLINVPVEVIYVPVTCSFFFLLPQRFVSKRLSLNQGPAAARDKRGGGGPGTQGMLEGAGCPMLAP